MLAKHGIDIDPRADILGGINGADLDRAAAVAGINLAKVVGGSGEDQRTGNGIAGHTTAETVDLASQSFFHALAHEIDIGDHRVPVAAAVLPLVADTGEQPAVLCADLDLAADLPSKRDRWVLVIAALVKADHGERNLRA